jgi:hypothetical protein
MTESARQTERANRLLLAALRTPEALPDWSLEDWDLLLRVARRTRLLGRLEAQLAALDRLDAIPERAANHLRSARNLVRHRHTLLTWELNRLLWATEGLDVPIIALKGVAYVLAELPAARGRFFADLDLLVPHADIPTIETAPAGARLDAAADQPLRRPLLPRLDARNPAPAPSRARKRDRHPPPPAAAHQPSELRSGPAVRPDPPGRRLARPSAGPHDMVLHALVHLFLEGDPQEGLRLRDLVDVADLLDHFGREPGFWDGLAPRAEAFGLGRPLYYGVRFAQRLLGCEIPEPVIAATERWAPIRPLRVLMDHLVPLAILPGHPDHPRRRAALARWLLYVRAHWLRMPPWLLVRHIVYKAWLRVRGVPKRVELTPQDLKRL